MWPKANRVYRNGARLLTWQKWTDETIHISLNQWAVLGTPVPKNHKQPKLACKERKMYVKMLHAELWVSTAGPLMHISQLLWSCPKSKKYSEVTSYPQRASRGLPHAFLSGSKGGRSNRITEQRGALNMAARKKVLLLADEIWASKVLVAHFVFPLLANTNGKLSCQQGNENKM